MDLRNHSLMRYMSFCERKSLTSVVYIIDSVVYIIDSVVYIIDSVVYIIDSVVYIIDSVVYIIDSVVYIIDSVVYIIDSVVYIIDSVVYIIDIVHYNMMYYTQHLWRSKCISMSAVHVSVCSPVDLNLPRASFQYFRSFSLCGKEHRPPLPHC